MRTACARHAHGMRTACARHAHGMRTACARHAHGMRTACARHACARHVGARREAASGSYSPPPHTRRLEYTPFSSQVRSERRHLWVALLYALEPLAEGWSKQTDARGRGYFYHTESGESRWRAPAYDAHRALLEDQHAASRALDAQPGGAAAQRALRLQRARSLAAMEKEREGVEEAEEAEGEQEALDQSMRLAFHQLLTAGFFRVDERTIMFSA
jgi:hypothetical protein